MNNRQEGHMSDWTTGELAKAASVSSTYIRQLLTSGRLNGYKKGRDWRISSIVAQRWLEAREENKPY